MAELLVRIKDKTNDLGDKKNMKEVASF